MVYTVFNYVEVPRDGFASADDAFAFVTGEGGHMATYSVVAGTHRPSVPSGYAATLVLTEIQPFTNHNAQELVARGLPKEHRITVVPNKASATAKPNTFARSEIKIVPNHLVEGTPVPAQAATAAQQDPQHGTGDKRMRKKSRKQRESDDEGDGGDELDDGYSSNDSQSLDGQAMADDPTQHLHSSATESQQVKSNARNHPRAQGFGLRSSRGGRQD